LQVKAELQAMLFNAEESFFNKSLTDIFKMLNCPASWIYQVVFLSLPQDETVSLSVIQNLGMEATLWTETNDSLSLSLSECITVQEVDHSEQATYSWKPLIALLCNKLSITKVKKSLSITEKYT
jgi:hypothetical protein